MKRLQVILSILYWLVVGALLWLGYFGDEAIDKASKTPVTHSAGFDAMAMLTVAGIIYGIVCTVWWGVIMLRRPLPRV